MKSNVNIDINLDLAKELAKKAIKNYQLNPEGEKKKVDGLRYGQRHGKLGLLRAQKLQEALNKIQDEAGLMAVFLAIFGNLNEGWLQSLNRSNALASLIADQWITGQSYFSLDYWGYESKEKDLINSTVFPLQSAEIRKPFDKTCFCSLGGMFQYHDKTDSVRYCLNEIIEKKYSPDEQRFIRKQAQQFRSVLQNTSIKEFSFSPLDREKKQEKKSTGFNWSFLRKKSPGDDSVEITTLKQPNISAKKSN
jgi:hypothetical protein